MSLYKSPEKTIRMKIKKYLAPAILLSVFAAFTISCAKEVTESSDSIEKRVLEAHVKVVYKDTISPLSTGIYMVNERKGTGKVVSDTSAVFVRYSTQDLRNNYLSTTYENVAKQVGSFAYSNYYGPVLMELGNYTLIKGLEEGLQKMKEGGKAKIIIPSWASTFNYLNSDKYHATTTVYIVEVVKVIDNYPDYELDTLRKFSNIHYDGLDTLKKGFYFKSLVEGTGDTLASGGTARVNYVGRLLNGFVFDTNIEDTARKYKIYSADKTYTPLSVELHEPGESTASGTSGVVDGFAKALLEMKYGGKAITFFGSEWGYGTQTQSFGKRQQLHFYIEVLAE